MHKSFELKLSAEMIRKIFLLIVLFGGVVLVRIFVRNKQALQWVTYQEILSDDSIQLFQTLNSGILILTGIWFKFTFSYKRKNVKNFYVSTM
jgi:hypothetical protein